MKVLDVLALVSSEARRVVSTTRILPPIGSMSTTDWNGASPNRSEPTLV